MYRPECQPDAMTPSAKSDRAGLGPALSPQGRRASQGTLSDDECLDDVDDTDKNSTSRKKRRLSKSIERKFACPFDGCTKSYGRAEHLSRHQLNHMPKQIYHCQQPNCDRRFVRPDLLNRHAMRHENRESGQVRTTKARYDLPVTYQDERIHPPKVMGHDIRRDSTIAPDINVLMKNESESPPDARDSTSPQMARGAVRHLLDRQHMPPPLEARPELAQLPHSQQQRAPINGRTPTSPSISQFNSTVAPDYTSGYTSTTKPPTTQTNVNPVPAYLDYHLPNQGYQRRYSDSFSQTSQNHGFQALPYLSPTSNSAATVQSSTGLTPFTPNYPVIPPLPACDPVPSRDNNLQPSAISGSLFPSNFDQGVYNHGSTVPLPTGDLNMPIFQNEMYHNAPFVSADGFYPWLFDPDSNVDSSALLHERSVDKAAYQLDFTQDQATITRNSHTTSGESSSIPTPSTPRRLAIREFGSFPTAISFDRRKTLLLFITSLNDGRPTVKRARDSVLSGDHDKHPHVLSLPMLQSFLAAFWESVHPQLPILHRPTFSADTSPDLLLLSMIALGASNLDRSHDPDLQRRSSDLSFFLAWHIRIPLFQSADFGPPAKLWVLQTLLLLELFEKMYSSRTLHERAHVHHSTTVSLIRRSSILTGRYSEDFPSDNNDDALSDCEFNQINSSGYNTSDPNWNQWISLEAARRIAFAAFVIDTTHAHLFGTSLVMVPHEMRIPLPCDEAMWAADSMSEVTSIQNRLETLGYRQVGFLEALKKTLNRNPVKTNTFGRVSIMAGLMSVSWHMKMQDVRVTSVGVGKQGNWGRQLIHAFDFWKKDFDASIIDLSQQPRDVLSSTINPGSSLHRPFHGELDRDNVFEARSVLHHLVHMVINSDVLDCMMFAGATRLLGRVVTPRDRDAACLRMRQTWAPSARARDATVFALKFLSSVLLPDTETDAILPSDYEACNDVLLNRPWALYIACMIVWSYGYANDGPLMPLPSSSSSSSPPALHSPAVARSAAQVLSHFDDPQARVRDMRAFLRNMMGRVQSSVGLVGVSSGRNAVLGLLLFLRDTFRGAKWELLHEAARTLDGCVGLLVPGLEKGTGQRA
ncbi:hypothetical protein K461DRAFT_270523 [Myriangium duriaei CBS 260.36]|uniref:C2H2-type domain-containing protein n=1 Tax=Myriangium duriaei CBS 260.36 TaxID=1168546 RepID=A0A9P4IUM4_9PEZI|nr:hypothetical protein K461DRAFT_270523 [Myriangium duriaei CBS 260.36]